ncbi:hypothetical protein SLS62_000239 [Diatrype stigma]|uniref:DUF7905 domain-containing protein n=1 Tax=Diatrype stigma TaxID=117547 RepID=A0AAN9V256_9PEZI
MAGRLHSPAVANFVLLGTEEPAAEILEATYKELIRIEGRYVIELRGNPPNTFIHIETGSQQETRNLLDRARELANELTSDDSSSSSIFLQEPLATEMEKFRITLSIQSSGARPKLDCPLGQTQKRDESGDFVTNLTRIACQGLKKVARQQYGVTLRVHLGQFVLQSYPRGQLSFEHKQFKAMVDNPRTSGRLETEVVDENMVRGILRNIQQGNGPLLPLDNQTLSPADVMPDHYFEANWENGRFQAEIVPITRDSKGKNPATEGSHNINRVKAFRGNSSLPELSITVLNLGRKFDWDMEVSQVNNAVNTNTTAIDQFLASAIVRMQGHTFDSFPKISLMRNDPVGRALKNIAVKSIYRYRWKATDYMVAIAINRRWASMATMGRPPKVDFSITMYGEHWDQLSQGSTLAAGNIWGDQLDLLFNDGDDAMATGEDRTRQFVGIVQELQGVLEKA